MPSISGPPPAAVHTPYIGMAVVVDYHGTHMAAVVNAVLYQRAGMASVCGVTLFPPFGAETRRETVPVFQSEEASAAAAGSSYLCAWPAGISRPAVSAGGVDSA